MDMKQKPKKRVSLAERLAEVQGLLGAAQRDTASPEARSVLADATRRISAMAAAQKVLYEENQPTSFSAEDFLHSVCAMAENGFERKPRFIVEQASGALSNDVAMPLALIMNELLTNAVKHGTRGARRCLQRP